MKRLNKYLEELESHIPNYSSHNQDISTANVGWQVGHAFKVIISVSRALEQSDPNDHKRTFNWKRSLFLTIGRFPRGKVRSPKHTRPDANIDPSDLGKLLSEVQNAMIETAKLSPTASFTHPVFGSLNLRQAHKFLELHTYHHLLIIRDIIK